MMQRHDRELPNISLAGSSSNLAQVMSLRAPTVCNERPTLQIERCALELPFLVVTTR